MRSILRGGLESALVLAFLVLVWRSWVALAESTPAPPASYLALGSWCAAAFLTRLEAAAALPVIVLLDRQRLRADPRRAIALLALPALAGAAYVLWNAAVFDTWLPISGAVKREVARQAPARERLQELVEFPWVGRELYLKALGRPTVVGLSTSAKLGYVAAGAAVLAVLAWRRERVRELVRRGRLALLVWTSLLMITADHLAVIAPSWYQVPIVLLTVVLVAGALDGTRAVRLAAGATLLLALARPPFALWSVSDPERFFSTHRIRAADWVRAHTEPGARIGSWKAGMLGYFSGRSVINLDGLANDREYLERVVRRKELEDYLDGEGISLLADLACGSAPSLAPYLARTGSERLESRLELVTTFGRGVERCPGYAVWRFEPR
jgi:hypothetical protein